jgi:hypothetical protein
VSEKYEITIKVELHEGLQNREVAEELKEQLSSFCYFLGNKKMGLLPSEWVKIVIK